MGFALNNFFQRENIIRLGGDILFSIMIFLIMFDPTNTILGLKDISFVLLVGYSLVFFKPDFSFVPHILIVYGVILISYVFAEMQMNRLDFQMLFGIIKGFSPLTLLLWCRHYDVVKLMKWPTFIVCTFISILYLVVISDETIELLVFHYVRNNGDMIMMTHRNFLGIDIFGMYYKSIISFVFALFIFYYNLFNKGNKYIVNIVCSLIMFFAFLVSGTRATMLLPFAMIALVLYKRTLNFKKIRYFLYPVLVLFVVALLFIIFKLATQEGEASNAMKYAHLMSYAKLFSDNPIYLIFGQGPGALFYSEGFNSMTSITEWTYLELFRCYGILSFVILGVLVWPLKTLWKYRTNELHFGFMCSYVMYLMIAGTNPLLISSTGMIVVVAIYSYTQILEDRSPEGMELSPINTQI